jgi:hypothetical protein
MSSTFTTMVNAANDQPIAGDCQYSSRLCFFGHNFGIVLCVLNCDRLYLCLHIYQSLLFSCLREDVR